LQALQIISTGVNKWLARPPDTRTRWHCRFSSQTRAAELWTPQNQPD